jgi:putative addiction module component (TIGR02574 family)
MNLADIKKMSTVERLKTMEALWDSLLYENEEMETPEWHEKIVEKRKAKIKSGKAKFISLSELKARLDQHPECLREGGVRLPRLQDAF